MKVKKYIHKSLLIKLGLFLVLLGAAWLFDHYNQGKQLICVESRESNPEDSQQNICFFCTPPSPVSFKTPVQINTPDKSIQEKFNRLIREQLNARSVFLLKAEVFKQPHSGFTFRNLVSFRYHFLNHPDDQPPLC